MIKNNTFLKTFVGNIDSIKYSELKNDPERAKKSVYFGVKSIALNILGAVLIPLCAWLIVAAIASENIIFIVVGVLIGGVGIISLLPTCLVMNLIACIRQLKLNKRAAGWVALATYILMIILIIVLTLLIFEGF